MTHTLNVEQKKAVLAFHDRENIFITGPGGTGKSFLIKYLVEQCETLGLAHQVTATTGRAALLLDCNATTIHRWAGIGLAKEDNEVISNRIMKSHYKRKVWTSTQILIIDEVSMMSRKIFELIDLIAKKCRRNNRPFGGMQVAFFGDFFQLPPVGDRNVPMSGEYCFKSPIWNETFKPENMISLNEIFRQNDAKFCKLLNEIRHGNISEEAIAILNDRVDREDIKTLEITPPIIFPIKEAVRQVNMSHFNAIKNTPYKFKYVQVVPVGLTNEEIVRARNFKEEDKERELGVLLSDMNSEQELEIKEGSQIMITANISFDREKPIVNGSLGIIEAINVDNILIKFSWGSAPITRYTYKSDKIPTVAVAQYPIILAWATTIHKSQGCTLDCANIDIGHGIFATGQSYVALSRVKSLDGLYLSNFAPENICVDPEVVNFYNQLSNTQLRIETVEATPLENTIPVAEVLSNDDINDDEIITTKAVAL